MRKLVSGLELGEAVVYDPATQRIFFSDARAGGYFECDLDGTLGTAIPHRKGIGGAVRHRDGGFVISGRNVAHKAGEETVVLLENDGHFGLNRFNDLGTDLDGRVYVGLLNDNAGGSGPAVMGKLFRIDLDGSAAVVDDEVDTANGIAVSPDGTVIYLADTGPRRLYCYDVRDSGLANRRTLVNFVDGRPDGIALSEDGRVWVALHGAGCVVAIDPDGKEVDRIPVPMAKVTNVCFGGPDLDMLFVTTSCEYQRGEREGGLFVAPVDARGFPVPVARVAKTISAA